MTTRAATICPITVAIAAPAIPNLCMPNIPKIRIGSRMIFVIAPAICATIGVFISPRACRILLQTPSVNSPILTTQTILPYTTTSRMISSEFVEILA